MTPIERVLDRARWAPSGDNTQPWRFQITGEHSCIVHAFDTRRHCVYDLTGAPSQVSVGAMLETARLASSGLGMRAEIRRLPGDEENLRFDMQLREDASVRPSPLVPYIEQRCTNRRPFSRRPLAAAEKEALQASVGSSYRLVWLEGSMRAEVARLLFASAKVRLTIPEAFAVHRAVIEWDVKFSNTRIPAQAVGLDPVGTALMRWAMKSWRRTNILSNYLGGTLLPRLQLDYLPGIGCAAHVMVVGDKPAASIDHFLDAGAAVQRLWLTATRLGLQHQPEMTPLIFAGYSRTGTQFSRSPGALLQAEAVRKRLDQLVTVEVAERAVWLGRLGQAAPPEARSLRRPLNELTVSEPISR